MARRTFIKVRPPVDPAQMVGIRTELRQRRARRKVVLNHQLEVAGLTMTELSRRTGVDLSYISRIWSGDRMPGLDTTIRLAEALGMTLQELADVLLPPIIRAATEKVVKETGNLHVGRTVRL